MKTNPHQSELSSQAAHIVVDLPISRLRWSYRLREEVGDHDHPESFRCSDHPAKRLERPLIARRLLQIPGIKEIWLQRRSIEVSVSEAFHWDELQPRIIRALHQTFWSSQSQIVVLQKVPGKLPSAFRLEQVVQSKPPQLPNRIVLEEENGIERTRYHLTLPLARAIFWKVDESFCKPPACLKPLIEAIRAVPGVTDISGYPYEIRVSHGAVFNKVEVQQPVIDILRQLFPKPASVVVEKAPLLGNSQTIDSPETENAVPEIRWRVKPASRILVALREGDEQTRHFHLGSELAVWNSLYDHQEKLPDWLQKPVEQLFDISGVAAITIEKYSMAVEIAAGFRWSKIQPAVIAILKGICPLPVQIIYQRRASPANRKTKKRLPKFNSPSIFWRADFTSSEARHYGTSSWPADARNWRLWKSDGRHRPGLDEFSPDLRHLIAELLQAPGVTEVDIRPYEVSVNIGKAFSWTECQPHILRILSGLYPAVEQQNILVRKKKVRPWVLRPLPKYKIGTARIFIARGYIEKIRDFHLSTPTLFGKSWCSADQSFRQLPSPLRRIMRKLAAREGVKSVTVYPWQVQIHRTDDTDNFTIEEMALSLLKTLFPQPQDVIVRRL